jgi:hypothetical protein
MMEYYFKQKPGIAAGLFFSLFGRTQEGTNQISLTKAYGASVYYHALCVPDAQLMCLLNCSGLA